MSEPKGPGITCPVCGSSCGTVTNSRKRDGFVWRRRECDACGARVSTKEERVGARVASEPDGIPKRFAQAAKARLDTVLDEWEPAKT